jgi:predicted  nucleic acid-binding Zn-ribbon protein
MKNFVSRLIEEIFCIDTNTHLASNKKDLSLTDQIKALKHDVTVLADRVSDTKCSLEAFRKTVSVQNLSLEHMQFKLKHLEKLNTLLTMALVGFSAVILALLLTIY